MNHFLSLAHRTVVQIVIASTSLATGGYLGLMKCMVHGCYGLYMRLLECLVCRLQWHSFSEWPAPKKPMVKEAGIVRDSVMRLLGPVVLLILYNDGLLIGSTYRCSWKITCSCLS